MSDRSTIAQSVAHACTESAGTVQALAEEVGVSYAALCSWSRGRRRPPAHRLLKLADVMERRAARLRELANELRQQAGQPAGSETARDGVVVGRIDDTSRTVSLHDPAADRLPLAASRPGTAPTAYIGRAAPDHHEPSRRSSIPLPPPTARR